MFVVLFSISNLISKGKQKMTEQNKTTKDQTLENLKNIIDELPKIVVDYILRKHDEPLEHRPYGLRRKILFDKISTNGGNGYISLLDLDDEIQNLVELQEKSQKIKKLENIVTDNELVKGVINMVLDHLEEPTDENLDRYIYEIQTYGCINGCVPGLIYYKDTHEFTRKYLEELLTLLNEYQQGTGEPVELKNDPVNFLAWFGFEVTLSNTLDMLDDLQPMTE